ncbi:MAG: low molecular weight phosphatase family protein [Chloroflexi bacterium]|jgi:protein-tyrosine phosphatase|nr:low molecular weight phosphatase family protein [Chloroflexota bacterium]
MPKQLLFLCSGNYYRSRFAEHWFNALARQYKLDWVADSRGLADDLTVNIGPIANATVEALAQRGVVLPTPHRYPLPTIAADFVQADWVIALKEAEHRPMMQRKFAAWADRITYWHIHDLDIWSADEGLSILATELEKHAKLMVNG